MHNFSAMKPIYAEKNLDIVFSDDKKKTIFYPHLYVEIYKYSKLLFRNLEVDEENNINRIQKCTLSLCLTSCQTKILIHKFIS